MNFLKLARVILSNDITSGSDIKPCNKIDKPQVVYRFSDVNYLMMSFIMSDRMSDRMACHLSSQPSGVQITATYFLSILTYSSCFDIGTFQNLANISVSNNIRMLPYNTTNEKVQKMNISYDLIPSIHQLPFHGMYFLPYRDQVTFCQQ